MNAVVKKQSESPAVMGTEEFPPTSLAVKEVVPFAAALRRWRLILGFAVGGGLAGYLLCQMLTPLYVATATVMIDPREPKQIVVSADPTSAVPPSEETVRKNEIAFIRSRKLAKLVVSDLHLAREPEFNPALRRSGMLSQALDRAKREAAPWMAATGLARAPAKETAGASHDRPMDDVVDALLNRLSTTSTEASRVIDIRFWSEDPERAALVANTIADEYIKEKVRQDVAELRSATRPLEEQIATLNLKIRDAERSSEKTRNQIGIDPAAGLRIAADRVSELNRELAAAAGERAAAAARVAELHTALASKRVDSLGSVLGSPLIQKLQEAATVLAAKISEISATRGPGYPDLIGARAQLADLRGQIRQEVGKIATSYANDLALAQAKERALQELVHEARLEQAEATASEVDVRTSEREQEANKSLMGQLVTRLADVEAQLNGKTPEAQIISTATVPRSPSFPPKTAIIAAAFLIFATGGTILAVLLERRDESIWSTAQLRLMTTARMLGAVPAVKGAGRQTRSPPARVLAERKSMYVEHLRAVWFQLDHSRAAEAKTLLITSSVSHEGKSSIAASLARLLALNGRRIVLVDADLRNPSVHKQLGLKPSPGLAEILEGTAAPEDILQVDTESGASVITAGSAVSSPAEILHSPKMENILEALSAQFDAVILDSPPLLAVHDAGILARQVDMTVMVVRWGATKETTFAAALQRLSDLDVPVGGVILSMVDRKKYDRYGYPGGDVFSSGMKKYYSS